MGGTLSGDTAAVILAAGKNTRMLSKIPKAMHKIAGAPMIGLVYDAVVNSGVKRCIVVVGFGAGMIIDYLGEKAEYAFQKEQLGTGHALQTALEYLDGGPGGAYGGRILALYCDMPFISPATLRSLVEKSRAAGEQAALVYADLPDPYGFGRVLHDSDGRFVRIVEQKDATEGERLIKAANVGVYCFDAAAARFALSRINTDNAQGELYLTDVFTPLAQTGARIGTYRMDDIGECLGVNDRAALAELDRRARLKKCESLMLESGVTIIDPNATYIDRDVAVGSDTVIYPGCVIEGRTVIGRGCEIGPHACIRDSSIGDGGAVVYSFVEGSVIDAGAAIGPFANILHLKGC